MSSPAPSSALQRRRFLLALLGVLLLGQGLRLAWQTQLVVRGIGGDGLHYWHMSAHIQREHMISFDGEKPAWTRLPGYPAMLALTTWPAVSDVGPMDPESIRVRVQAWMRRQTFVDVEIDLLCALGALWLALGFGAGRVALLAALIWVVQPWSTVISIHPLSDGLATFLSVFCLAAIAHALRSGRAVHIALAGALAGLAQWVRSDAILLLAPVALGAALMVPASVWPPGAAWRSALPRARLVAVALGAYALVFAPWPIRNQLRFGEPHILGGGTGIGKNGEPLDRSAAFDWLRTFCDGSEAHSVGITWVFPGRPFSIADVPPEALDSPAEKAEVAAILVEYNRRGAQLDDDLGARLRAVARAHVARHPFDYYVKIPAIRIFHRLFGARDGFGFGTLPTLTAFRPLWIIGDTLEVLFGLFGMIALVIVPQTRRIGVVVTTWLVLRLLMIGSLPASEPRYFLEALPLLAALCASVPASWKALRAGRVPPSTLP